MSINTNPTGVYADYTYSSNGTLSTGQEGIFLPLTSLPSFESAEADEAQSTSDYRKLIWALVSGAEDAINSLSEEEKPSKMTASKSGLTFQDEDTARRSYTFTFDFAISNLDIEAED